SPAPSRRCGSQYLVEGDRKVANPDARGVINRIGDRRGDAGRADLADAFHAEWVHKRVFLVDEDDVDVGYVGVHRHEVFTEVGVQIAAAARVDGRVLGERHGQPVDNSAGQLAAGCFRIQDSA